VGDATVGDGVCVLRRTVDATVRVPYGLLLLEDPTDSAPAGVVVGSDDCDCETLSRRFNDAELGRDAEDDNATLEDTERATVGLGVSTERVSVEFIVADRTNGVAVDGGVSVPKRDGVGGGVVDAVLVAVACRDAETLIDVVPVRVTDSVRVGRRVADGDGPVEVGVADRVGSKDTASVTVRDADGVRGRLLVDVPLRVEVSVGVGSREPVCVSVRDEVAVAAGDTVTVDEPVSVPMVDVAVRVADAEADDVDARESVAVKVPVAVAVAARVTLGVPAVSVAALTVALVVASMVAVTDAVGQLRVPVAVAALRDTDKVTVAVGVLVADRVGGTVAVVDSDRVGVSVFGTHDLKAPMTARIVWSPASAT
jgi:hypothetical protein